MRLVLDQSYPVGGADHEALATAVMESKAELLIGGNYRNDAIQLTKALDAVGYAPRLVSLSTSAADPAFAEETGELARCVAGYALWLPSIATQGGLASNDVFVQRFRQANGSDPSYLAASSFAAVELLTEAARATTAASGEIDHGAVRDYLFATSTRTILGPYAVVARGEVASFWERLVQPHVFFLMVQAFPPLHRPVPRRKWRRAVATGQYLLFKRKAYNGIGGHEAVKDAVVEDLRLAQLSTQAGYAVAIRDGGTSLKTRMYQSLGAILEGWSKNMSIGAKQTYGPVRGRLLLAEACSRAIRCSGWRPRSSWSPPQRGSWGCRCSPAQRSSMRAARCCGQPSPSRSQVDRPCSGSSIRWVPLSSGSSSPEARSAARGSRGRNGTSRPRYRRSAPFCGLIFGEDDRAGGQHLGRLPAGCTS